MLDQLNRDWIAVHIFYASSIDPLLVECVTPLVARLRDERLIDGYFFIRYWQEGTHVRLRVRPADPAHATRVRQLLEYAIGDFLRRRPALYDLDHTGMAHVWKDMYLREYTEEQWVAQYGEDGEMPFRPNNSFAYFDYEPEYGRYGGPAGMALAEWHFERSSDLALHLVATTNVHVRPILLGLGCQVSAAMCYVFLSDDDRVMTFLDRYRSFWEGSYTDGNNDGWHRKYDRSYERMRIPLRERLRRVRAVARGETVDEATPWERQWIEHCRELRSRLLALAESGQLASEQVPTGDPFATLQVLLSAYVHMTSNRLGVGILDESYLAYVMSRAVGELREAVPA
jgi:thiopeptide-type bacteriocin biosynthesis protein